MYEWNIGSVCSALIFSGNIFCGCIINESDFYHCGHSGHAFQGDKLTLLQLHSTGIDDLGLFAKIVGFIRCLIFSWYQISFLLLCAILQCDELLRGRILNLLLVLIAIVFKLFLHKLSKYFNPYHSRCNHVRLLAERIWSNSQCWMWKRRMTSWK